MLSDSPCKDDHALFTMVPLKAYKDTNNFEIDFFGFATKVTYAKTNSTYQN